MINKDLMSLQITNISYWKEKKKRKARKNPGFLYFY